MLDDVLAAHQRALISLPVDSKIFLEGPAGTGKTTASAGRLLHLLNQGVPADSMLVMVPQRTLARPYEEALHLPDLPPGGQATVVTLGGLAQRMVELFWPLVAEPAGFAYPDLPPTFLTLETAQYYMADLVQPMLELGHFESVTIDRSRLYSQILDNLNKAAVVGFSHREIADRLKAAWIGDKSQLKVYEDAQVCAEGFRAYCLAHNLLDFSLQYELFARRLWPSAECRNYLLAQYTCLVVDNVEEDTPVAHDILRQWLSACGSALVVYDCDAGYRRFLGADPHGAYALKAACRQHIEFHESFVSCPALESLGWQIGSTLLGTRSRTPPSAVTAQRAGGNGDGPLRALDGKDLPASLNPAGLRDVLVYEYHRYHPQMIDWVAGEIAGLVQHEGTSPGEIVVLAPFLTDALRFLLVHNLERRGIACRSHRPSRALREEPATLCLLTLAALAHPQWHVVPPSCDVALCLSQAIWGLDLVRAHLLSQTVYRAQKTAPVLGPFEQLGPEARERITYVLGERYDRLRCWLEAYRQGAPAELDHFLSRLFGEVLSQPGYGFYQNLDAGAVAANLIESVQKFRWAAEAVGDTAGADLSLEYVRMVQDGVVAAQYVRSWQLQPDDAVFLAPAYTFLMANRPVAYQFWLDVGSSGWWERLNQPLTHPHVLSRSWRPGQAWADEDEFNVRQEALHRLVLGLLRRCRKRVYLGLSELGEQGVEQQGPLLRAVQQVLRRLPVEQRAPERALAEALTP